MRLLLEILFKELYRAFTEKNYREFLRLVLLFGNTPRYVQKNIKFLNCTFSVPDMLSFIWQFKEIFVDENYKFKTNSSQPVIYDCGANIGTSVAYFKKIFPNSKLKAFEANPQIAEILLQNIKKNNIKDVEIIKKDVWINNDGVEFALEGADGTSIFIDSEKIKLPSVRLKDLIQKEEKIDFLKMDIEGAETAVLKDCSESLKIVKNLFVEFHSFVNQRQDLDELLSVLTKSGFRYFIKPAADRKIPFVNRINKNNPAMDLQLNIYAYRVK